MNLSSWFFVSDFIESFMSVLAGLGLIFALHICVDVHDEMRAIRQAVVKITELLAEEIVVLNSKRPRRNPRRQAQAQEPPAPDSGGT